MKKLSRYIGIVFVASIIGCQSQDNKSVQDKGGEGSTLEVVCEIFYSTSTFEEQLYQSGNTGLYLLSEVRTNDTVWQNNHRRLQVISLSKAGMLHKEESKVISKEKVLQLIDSLSLNAVNFPMIEVVEKDRFKNDTSVLKRFDAYLNKGLKVEVDIKKLGEGVVAEVLLDDVSQTFKLTDCPNYSLEVLDLDGDDVNELLLFSYMMNNKVNLKIIRRAE